MKIFLITNNGLEKTAQQEIKELVGIETEPNQNILNFIVEGDERENLLKLFFNLQSVRRLCLSLGKIEKINNFSFDKINWPDFFTSDLSIKIEVENVRGNENRLNLAKVVAGKIFTSLKEKGICPKIELKNPDLLIIVYYTGKEYYLGLDFSGIELNNRDYRVFTNPSSFKGDYAYFILRNSRFKKNDKLLVGLMKDGTIAIEAALFNYGLPVQGQKINRYSFSKFPLFKEFDFEKYLDEICFIKKKAIKEMNIYAFDESVQNFNAARKNAQLAGVNKCLELKKYSLDELDVKFSENYFDHLIFQLTTKSEDQLNEIYYQASYILKKKGTLMLISRGKFELSVSSKFKLLSEKEIKRGESTHKVWLLERK